jgi:hypothetical protein
MDDDTFTYTEVDGQVTVVGRLVTCACGRRLFALATAVMPRTVPKLSARCLDCLTIDDALRAAHPAVAAQVDRWKSLLP